jgi:hypothetical protein
VRRAVTAALLLALLPAVVLAGCGRPEGVRLVPAAPATAEQLLRARDQVEARLEVLRPDTSVVIDGGGLRLEMPPNEATRPFVEQLTAPGRVAIVAVEPGQPPPAEGLPLAVPPLVGPNELLGGRLIEGDQPTIEIAFRPQAVPRVRGWTTNNVSGYLAVTADDVVIIAPTINEPIRGAEIQITLGNDAGDEIRGLAAALASGALELALELRVGG